MKPTIPDLKTEWDSLQPLPSEHDRRLWQKLRLEWNYHSNHIEGNTLTYGETELLLIHGQTHGNHTIREYEEMKAHDVGITHLRELAEDRTRLIGESDIRNLNKIILKEPFWKPAQTSDGQATRKQIVPGEYKTSPNNVRTATGELFEFAAPSDVPARMQALVQWLEHALSGETPSVLPILAKLHHDFVLIHPFDDGNGRVARMLVNYVLMRQGYPPIIVPTERKLDYLAALRLADVGDISELEDFLGSCVARSLLLGIKAAKGESLHEPGDLEKEISVYIRNQDLANTGVVEVSKEHLKTLYDAGFRSLFDLVERKMGALNPLFLGHSLSASSNNQEMGGYEIEYDFNEAYRKFSDRWDLTSPFIMTFSYMAYKGKARNPFDFYVHLSIEFEHAEYVVKADNLEITRKLYTQPVLNEEAERIAETLLSGAFAAIKAEAEQT